MAELVRAELVRLQGLGLVLGTRQVLHDLDALVPLQPITTLLGPNGAGKSVLLRCLHGLLPATQGSVQWPRLWRQGMVFQRPALLRRSVRANLVWAWKTAGQPGPERPSIDQARIDTLLNRLDLSSLADRPARVLSGGEQQRLALARAWLLRPELLLLDEPCASLDPGSIARIEDCLREMAAEGIKLLMATHLLGQAHRLSDQVIFLHEGGLTEVTPAKEFFHRPRSIEARHFLAAALP